MKEFKYNPGFIQNNQELISRDYCDSNNNWYCTFKCLDCGDVFQMRLNRFLASKGKAKCSCLSLNKDKEMIGKTKGVLTIIGRAPKRPNNRNLYWYCQCKTCGEIVELSTGDINRHKYSSCLKSQTSGGGGRRPSLKPGDKFDQLEVMEYLGNQRWKCRCSCGNCTIKKTQQLTLQNYNSCNLCSVNSYGEKRISEILKENNISFETQKTFESCRFPNTNYLAKFDFYLPNLNILIEYNGIQHYSYRNSGWNTEENFKQTQYRDNYKINWCKNNCIKLIIIPYTDYNLLSYEYLKNKIEQ